MAKKAALEHQIKVVTAFYVTALYLLIVPSMFASTITGPIPTITTTCKIGGDPVTCGTFSNPNRFGMFYWVGADATAGMSGLDTAAGISINVHAEATSSRTNSTGPASADALGLLDFFASTDGAERQGLATFKIVNEGDHGAFAGALAIGSVAGLGSCTFTDCYANGTLVPFELGVAFEVIASVHAQSCCEPDTFAGAYTSIQLQLFELDGTPVTIFDAVPEPASWILAGIGILALVGHLSARHRFSVR